MSLINGEKARAAIGKRKRAAQRLKDRAKVAALRAGGAIMPDAKAPTTTRTSTKTKAAPETAAAKSADTSKAKAAPRKKAAPKKKAEA